MMMLDEETLKKITGDIGEEVPEAAYRLAASVFVKGVEGPTVNVLVRDETFRAWLNKNKQISEFVVGYVLAAFLELIPMPSLDDERKRLAYNLRVRSIEGMGELGLIHLDRLLPLRAFLLDQAHNAISLAKGDLILVPQAAPDGREKEQPV